MSLILVINDHLARGVVWSGPYSQDHWYDFVAWPDGTVSVGPKFPERKCVGGSGGQNEGSLLGMNVNLNGHHLSLYVGCSGSVVPVAVRVLRAGVRLPPNVVTVGVGNGGDGAKIRQIKAKQWARS